MSQLPPTADTPKELTNKQKWAWVIGLTAGIYALLYYVSKQK